MDKKPKRWSRDTWATILFSGPIGILLVLGLLVRVFSGVPFVSAASDTLEQIAGVAWYTMLLAVPAYYYAKYQDEQVQRRFHHLSDKQKIFLLEQYKKHERYFSRDDSLDRDSVIELTSWNYVESSSVNPGMLWTPPYTITKMGWREIERFDRESHLYRT